MVCFCLIQTSENGARVDSEHIIEYPGLSLNVFLFLAGLGKEYHEYSNLAFFDHTLSFIETFYLWSVRYRCCCHFDQSGIHDSKSRNRVLSCYGSTSKRVTTGSVGSARKILLIHAFCMDLRYWLIFCWKYACNGSACYSIQWIAHVKDHRRVQHNVVLVLMFTNGLCIQVLWYEICTPEDMQNVVFYKQVVFTYMYRRSLDQVWLL